MNKLKFELYLDEIINFAKNLMAVMCKIIFNQRIILL